MNLTQALYKIVEAMSAHGVTSLDYRLVDDPPVIAIEAFDSSGVPFLAMYDLECAKRLIERVASIDESCASEALVVAAMKDIRKNGTRRKRG